MSSSRFCDVHPTLLGEHTEENVTGVSENYNTYWDLWNNLKERDHLEKLGVDKDNIKIHLTKEKLEDV
jgi:hypothetical protein